VTGNQHDAYFYEAFEEEAAALKRFLPPKVHAGFTWQTVQEAGHAAPPAPLISVRTQSQIPSGWGRVIDGVLTRSTGYDHIVAWIAALDAPIPAGYLPLYCNRAVAEQACLLWMALLRKLPQQVEQFARFHRDGITGFECRGRAITVFGVGNIGSEIVNIARGLEMDVRGVDIVHRHKKVKYVKPREGLLHADVLVCAMNLTADNDAYFNYDTLKLARPGTLFVNIARGELSPSADLNRLLDEGILGGAGLDVYAHEKALAVALREGQSDRGCCPSHQGHSKEMLRQAQHDNSLNNSAIPALSSRAKSRDLLPGNSPNHPDPCVATTLELAARKNVITLPHNAFNTIEAVERKAEQSMEAVAYFRRKKRFPYPVPNTTKEPL
jgi:D-lactate dehydrogenase